MPANTASIHFHVTNANRYPDALAHADRMADKQIYVGQPDGSQQLMHRDEIASALDAEEKAAQAAANVMYPDPEPASPALDALIGSVK
jgi:hypothetical protein